MREYVFIGRDKHGNRVEGSVSAENSARALGQVCAMGYSAETVRAVSVTMTPKKAPRLLLDSLVYAFRADARLKELRHFYHQFGALIAAGLPVYQALGELEKSTFRPELKEVLRECRRQVEAGGKLADVFAATPQVFGAVQVELLRAAEYGGALPELLRQIADFLDYELRLRRFLSYHTLYAKAVFLAGMLGIPLGFALLMGGNPWYAIKDNLFALLWMLGAGGVVIAICRTTLLTSEKRQRAYERLKWRLPGVGVVARKMALAKFGRAFAVLTKAGVPLSAALRIALMATGSIQFAGSAEQIVRDTEAGLPLAVSFRQTGLFPSRVLDMMETGEQSGDLERLMQKSAEYLEGEAESASYHIGAIVSEAFFVLIALYLFRGLIFPWSNF